MEAFTIWTNLNSTQTTTHDFFFPEDRLVRILHLEDDRQDRELVADMLASSGIHCEIVYARDFDTFRSGLTTDPDLIISDFSLPGYNGLRALEYVQELRVAAPFVVFSGTMGEETAVESLQHGATDYVLKQRPRRLVAAVRRALAEAEQRAWRRRAEAERKVAEERILEQAALLDEARDAICVTDLDQRILFWNRSAERLYGWAFHEAIGQSSINLLQQNGVALDAMKRLIQVGGWHGELKQTTRSGSQLIVESRWTLIRNGDNSPKSILIINTDVTKRKKAEEKIREQAALLDKASDAILLCDLRQEIVYWNEGATRLYGWTAAEALGRNAEDLLFDHLTQDARSDVFNSGEWTGELRHVHKHDGKELTVLSRQTLVRNDATGAVSILHINSDITEKKRLEEQFLRTQRLQNLGSIAGGVAHDLNNILSPIMMAVEMMQSEPESRDNSQLLEIAGSSAMRGAAMVKQILSFVRGTDDQKVSLQLSSVIQEVVRLVTDTFPRNIQIKTHLASELPETVGNPTQFHQVLMNLCVNSRDAMPAGGALTIKAVPVVLHDRFFPQENERVSGCFIELSVADTGDGMPLDVQKRIFEPFFSTKAPGKGTGLGLSTVLSIIKSHGGYLEVLSAPGQGTTFQIYLPTDADAAAPAPAACTAKLEPGRGERVLVVDDEIALLEIVSATLSAYNYSVLTATAGPEGLALFADQHAEIDLVITDMNMPAMGSMDLIEALRSIRKDIKIIQVSGLPMEMADCKPETSAFLNKPFTVNALLSTIRTCLDS